MEPMVPDELVWSDEFDDTPDGSVDATKWKHLNGPNDNNQELQWYTDSPNNSRVDHGALKITATCSSDYGRYGYTSARLVTSEAADWGPGHRVEIRAKLPGGIGTWPAIWMLPSDSVYGNWPHSGEIDIVESVGCNPDKVYGTVHTEAFNHMHNTQVGRESQCDFKEWHTYTIDWENSTIRWYVDGKQYQTFAPDTNNYAEWPFAQKFYLILNVAVGGSWGGYCLGGPPSCSDEAYFGKEQVMEVDYVRIYTLVAQNATNATDPTRRLNAPVMV